MAVKQSSEAKEPKSPKKGMQDVYPAWSIKSQPQTFTVYMCKELGYPSVSASAGLMFP